MPATKAVAPDLQDIDVEVQSPSVGMTKVLVWPIGENSCLTLEEVLHRWKKAGWHVRLQASRVLEGPICGVLLVLERRPGSNKRLCRDLARAESCVARRHRQDLSRRRRDPAG